MNALYSNTIGYNNSAQGAWALYSNTTGYNNSAQGVYALYPNTFGSYNLGDGYQAGRHIADGITPNTTPDRSVFLGAETKALTANDTNQIVIGYDAVGLGSNTVVLGNDDIITTALKGNVGIDTTSPGEKLDINGAMHLTPGSTPTTADEGDIYMDSTTHKLRVYDGTLWHDLW